MSQQYVTGQQWENTCSSTAVLSVVSEWVIGHWLWIHVMNCTHDFSPLGHTNYARWLPVFLKVHLRSIQQSMKLSWRACVLYYCGSSRYGSSYTYHKTSAWQYFWRVHRYMYATDALLAKLYDGKYDLFRFISKELQRDTADLHYELLTTNADLVFSNKPTDMTALSPCQQEEADKLLMLHLYHAAGQDME